MKKLLLSIFWLLMVLISSFSSATFTQQYYDYWYSVDWYNWWNAYNTKWTLISYNVWDYFSSNTNPVEVWPDYRNTNRIICAYFPQLSSLWSTTSILSQIKNLRGYLQWNIVNRVNNANSQYWVYNTTCVYYASWSISEVSMSQSMSLSNISSLSVTFKFFTIDDIESTFGIATDNYLWWSVIFYNWTPTTWLWWTSTLLWSTPILDLLTNQWNIKVQLSWYNNWYLTYTADNFNWIKISSNYWPCQSCWTCEDQYTSLECQTEYNLIPIENVTENYCTSNFNLISPSDCPVSWWTWDINWSSVWINNQQVVWSPNIFLNIYDKLDWSQTYVNQDMYIDVNGPEGDEEYINWIIGINTYRPTSEDFTTVFVSGLTLLFPYIVITLFVLFIRKLIRKIFK